MLWHGETDHPVDPATTWLTATPPPATVTMAESHAPAAGVGTVGTDVAVGGNRHRRVLHRAAVGRLAHRGGDRRGRWCWS